MQMTVEEIALQVGGEISGDGKQAIHGIAPAATAKTGELTFADNASFFALAEQSQASAVLVPKTFESATRTLIRVKDVRLALAKLLPLFEPAEQWDPGVHPMAVVHPTASVHASAHIGAHCIVGAEATIGEGCVLMGGNHIGRRAILGARVKLYPNVVIGARCEIGDRVTIHASTVIGSDGYGYVFDNGVHRKVPQIGNVVIHADVEIGSNASIDRAALGSTVIGQGTKIDNLVHVAHNVSIGRHCLVMGQVGFAGSTQMGDYSVIASQSGIAGHLTLGRQVMVGAKSGVMRDIPDKGVVLGIPAMPDKQTKRQWVALQQLPDVLKRLRALEQSIAPSPAGVSEGE